jgi:glycosyltransferase involved in cell wall biosynthesis
MPEKAIAIITHSFLDQSSGSSLATGGVETWVLEMVKLLSELEIDTTVYQTSEHGFATVFEGASVIGHGISDRNKMLRLSHDDIDKKGIERIIYATSVADEKHMRSGQIFVQHGIHWDYTTSGSSIYSRLRWEYLRRKLSRNDIRMSLKSKLTIAVDTNFINYARIVMRHRFNPLKLVYIPNFAWPRNIEKWGPKWINDGEIRIVFARRFEYRRGVTLFGEVTEKLLQALPAAKISFAGCGTYEKFLREKFKDSANVSVTEVTHDKIYDLLCNSHIAVIPTIYSEGTSLTCLEAMASGCAVVVTDVGGLCNIVIPDYNGLLVRPVASEFTDSIIYLANNWKEAARLAGRGHELVSESFSAEMWRIRIKKALEESGFLEKK